MPASDERHKCQYSGCRKSFARKEHLVRHVQSHEEANRHTCQVCHREFSRSDSLQRHLLRHGDLPKPSPSGRSKHACVACHASKIKCDGSRPCSRCRKKGLGECRYELTDQSMAQASPAPTLETQPTDDIPAVLNSDNHMEPPILGPIIDQSIFRDVELPVLSDHIPQLVSTALRTNRHSPIDWASMTIEKDPPNVPNRRLPFEASPLNSGVHLKEMYPLPEAASQKYLGLYSTYFHHRWTIVHVPSVDGEQRHSIVVSSMRMIGAWISGSQDAKWLAVAMHERLMAHLVPQLLRISSSDKVDVLALIPLFQSSLLNIIFALYCGVNEVLSRAILLRNILVAVLREVKFFSPDSFFDDPKIFLPLRLRDREDRQRLAGYLFKVDSYISMLRCQPPLLTAEDIHYCLPSTYALHNADGLNIFETRYSIDPAIRSRTTICSLIRDADLDDTPAEGLMLAEDIQLGICSLQSRLWNRAMRSHIPDFNTAIELTRIRQRLESWRRLLSQIPISEPDTSNFSEGQHWAMRYYYGMEDHSKAGWLNTVYYRQKDLVYDGIALYHLSGLTLHSNVRILSQLAEDMIPNNPNETYGNEYMQAHLRRETFVREWSNASNARRALCHAAAVLGSYNEIPLILRRAIDPITYVAFSMGALVVWAYSSFTNNKCRLCSMRIDSGAASSDLQQFELTRWSAIDAVPALEKEKEDWIEAGEGFVTIGGIIVCQCNLSPLASLYHSCLPQDWDVANAIAPGIFKSKDTGVNG